MSIKQGKTVIQVIQWIMLVGMSVSVGFGSVLYLVFTGIFYLASLIVRAALTIIDELEGEM